MVVMMVVVVDGGNHDCLMLGEWTFLRQSNSTGMAAES
jgi:hypothetical protein